ncbi:MAG: hypothetical protein V7720_16105 [Halioglobus sp.]
MDNLLRELEGLAQQIEEPRAGVYALAEGSSGHSDLEYVDWKELQQRAA